MELEIYEVVCLYEFTPKFLKCLSSEKIIPVNDVPMLQAHLISENLRLDVKERERERETPEG